jgi:hypothetical protein
VCVRVCLFSLGSFQKVNIVRWDEASSESDTAALGRHGR